MDLEKLKSLSTTISMVVIPVVVLFVGNEYTDAFKEREIQGKFVELAITILKEDPSPETKSLREWATRVINQYSGVQLNPPEREALIKSIPIPSRSTNRDDISGVQGALKEMGYYDGHVDGIMGMRMREAVKSFQEEHGLVADGTIGPRTYKSIMEARDSGFKR